LPTPGLKDKQWYRQNLLHRKGGANVRFGSKADTCNAPTNVRFTANSDRKSGHWVADPSAVFFAQRA